MIKLAVIFLIFSNIAYPQSFNQTIKFQGGTSVICIITPDEIWIAADTKMVTLGSSKTSKRRKIFNTNNAYYAFAGRPIVLTANGTECLNAIKALNAYILKEKDLVKAFNAYNNYYMSTFDSLINISNKEDLEMIAGFIGKPFISTILVSYIGNKPLIIYKTLEVRNYNGKYKTICTDSSLVTNKTVKMFMGYQTEIGKYLKENKNYLDSGDLRRKLIYLIKKEVVNNPKKVGSPIDVLLIRKNSHKWYLDNY